MLKGGMSKMTKEERRKFKNNEVSALDVSYNNIYGLDKDKGKTILDVSVAERKKVKKELAEVAKAHGESS